LSLFFFGLGTCLHYLNDSVKPDFSFQPNETIVFKVSKKLNSTEKNKKYETVVQAGKNVFNAVVYIPKEHEELDFEHYYKAKAYVGKPQSPEQDFQFDYARYLHRKNIFYQCFINDEISGVQRNDLSFEEKVRQKRLNILKKINQSEMSPKSQEFLKGIILADRTETDSGTIRDFNRSGLVHFLAISGTHVVVIFGMFYFFLMKILPLKFRKSIIILSLIFIWIFALFIGFGNSVVRSCIMLTVYFIFILLQRKPDLLHSLALSAFIILMIDTQQIFDVGFQLSFMAVLGIFWLNQPILKYLPKQDYYVEKVVYNTISISISAQLATIPLVLYYFHQFSLISIIANFIIVPFSEVIIIFSFIMAGLVGLSLDFGIISYLYDCTIQVLLITIHWFASFDVVFFENVPMNWIEVIALFAILYLLRFIIVKYDFKNLANFLIAVLIFFIVRYSFGVYENHKEEIVIHHYRKSKIVSVKKGDTACFWVENIKDKDKIQQYIINPYISSVRIEKVVIKTLPASAEKVVFNNQIYDLK